MKRFFIGGAAALAILAAGAAALLPASAMAERDGYKPVPKKVMVNDDKALLGEKLYHDVMLSVDGTLSCASCHALDKGGVDQLPLSPGVGKQLGGVNSPTVFNSHRNFVQFWDGRAKDLGEQALGPVQNPVEMGETWPNVVEKVKANKDYAEAFKRLYGGSITKEKIAHAIAEFEKTLITPNSRFDKYLEGDDTALSEQEKKGFELFKSTGCTTCHTGDYFGGQSYQMMSKDYFKERGTPLTDGDMGRFNVTKKEEDRHMLKVPMLRNVAVTPPYYHDGSVKTLDEAVTKMAKYQLGAELKPEETQAIVAFLKTLTGEYKGVPLDQVKAAN